MIDRKTQMMDAGMVLFQTEKPLGTVLGGIKQELLKACKEGKLYRRNEITEDEVPESTGDFDIFVDWSGLMRKRYIALRLEDAGEAGRTPEGEEIRRYAAWFREGNANPLLRRILTWGGAALLLALGIIGVSPIPRIFTIPAALAVGGWFIVKLLEPSKSAQKKIAVLLSIIKEAK